MNKMILYSRKPLACSSPIVTTINGKEYRVHDGHKYGYTTIIEPSKYPADVEDVRKLNEEINNAETILLD